MSLPPLKFDATEKVILRVHSSYSIGQHTPAEIAVIAEGQGLSVIALTDCATVAGIPEMIIAGEKMGIYVVPGVEINSSEGNFLGYFIDYQDKNLLKFLEKIKKPWQPEGGMGFSPSPQEIIRVLSNAGGLPILAGSGDGIPDSSKGNGSYSSASENKLTGVMGGNILPKLQQELSDNSLHKDYFRRMFWRSANLSPDEFVESLRPQIMRINKIRFESLINTVIDDGNIPADFQGFPFIILRGEALEKAGIIRSILESFNCCVISEIKTDRYREIAWKIYNMGYGSTVQKTRNLLKFNVDYRLYGEKSAQCLIFFFQNLKTIPLSVIKKALRKEIGRMRFYRIEYLNYTDTFFTAFVHISDEDNIQRENWILYHLGISVPLARA